MTVKTASADGLGDRTGDLTIRGLRAGYGPAEVLFGLELTVGAGEIVALLGRNGAGKSTTLKAIMGLASVHSGSIELSGREVVGELPHTRCRRGLGYVPQERRIFPDLTVEENLEVGRWRGVGAGGGEVKARAYEMFPVLRELRGRRGESLSGGEQQMLTIARTLMGEPRVLLLDEPTEGLAPRVVRDLGRQIVRLGREGMGILLAEQNLQFAQHVCERAYVMDKGVVQWSGTREDLMTHPESYSRYILI